MIYLVCGALAALSGILLYALMLAAARADERAEREWLRRQEMELLQVVTPALMNKGLRLLLFVSLM